MPLVTQSIPSMLNGVSQQPASQRHPTQGEAQLNCISGLSTGLGKRPAFSHVAKLANAPSGHTPKYHAIKRDTTERYIVTFREWGIDVYDVVNDSSPSVSVSSQTKNSLFSATAVSDGAALIVAIPEGGSSITLASTISGTATVVWESSADEAFTSPATLRTDTVTTSATVSWTPGTDNGKYVRARVSAYTSGTIAATITSDDLSYLAAPGGDMRTYVDAITVADYTFVLNRSVTTAMDPSLKPGTYAGAKQKFSDLAPAASVGDIWRIEGSDADSFTDYYVTDNVGVWYETSRPGIEYQFQQHTMPHTLVREADGSFTFGPAGWTERSSGDEDSAADPKFVGEVVQDIVFWRNRLGFLASEYASLSRVGNAPGGFFAFWPESVQSVLDSDPIDRGMAHTKVANLRFGVTFNETLLLFSDETQFVMNASGILTPETATVDPTTEFSTARNARPEPVGNNVYFPVENGNFAQVREYYVQKDTVINDAADVTAHVTEYIPAGVHQLTGSSNQDLLLALTSGDPDGIYVYKYYWDGDRKAQSSWSKWELPDTPTLHLIEFLGSELILVAEYSDGVYLLRARFGADDGEDDLGVEVLLDRRTQLTGSYSAGTGLTTWTLPYATTVVPTVVLASGFGSEAGRSLGTTLASSTTVTAEGDFSASSAWVGLPYRQQYRFSEQFRRARAGRDGAAPPAILGGRLQLRRWQLRYADSGYFEVHVTPAGRDTATYKFTGKVLGDAVMTLGDIRTHTGTFAFDVYARSSDVTIDIINDTWLPATFLSAEWVGLYSPHAVLPSQTRSS